MSGHLAVIPARSVLDQRVGNAGLRVLLILGSHTDKAGWCRVKQETIADLLGVGRQAVSRQVVALTELGYVKAQRTGRSSRYRVVLDVPEQVANQAAMPHEGASEESLIPPGVASDAPSGVASDAPSGGGIYRTTSPNDVPQRRSTTRGEPLSAALPATSIDFLAFWSCWPARAGKKLDRRKAETEWARMTTSQRAAAVVGAGHLRDAIAAGGAFGPPDAWRWLRDMRWIDWQEPAKVTLRPSAGASVGDRNVAALRRLHEPNWSETKEMMP